MLIMTPIIFKNIYKVNKKLKYRNWYLCAGETENFLFKLNLWKQEGAEYSPGNVFTSKFFRYPGEKLTENRYPNIQNEAVTYARRRAMSMNCQSSIFPFR